MMRKPQRYYKHDCNIEILQKINIQSLLNVHTIRRKDLACNNLLFKVVCKMHRKYLTISICNNSVLCNSFITYNYACEGVDFFNLPTVSGQNTPFLVLYLVPSNVNFMVLRICNLFSLKHLYILNEVNVLLCVYLW